MHRALSSLACVFLVLPGCESDEPDAAPQGGGGEGSGGELAPTTGGEDVGEDDDGPGTTDGDDGRDTAGGGGDGGQSTSGDESSSGAPPEPAAVCGDGIVEGDESCDDGARVDGDGCEADCSRTVGVQLFATGGAHTCAVDFEGQVRCFGDNTYGQLGIESTEKIGDDESPVDAGLSVDLPEPIRQISAGLEHTCGLSVDGAVYCWGRNKFGQLGYGHDEDWGDEVGETPASAGAVALGGPAVAVVAGRAHTCASLSDGSVRCWGGGELGQLGLGGGFDGTVGAGADPYPDVIDAPALDLGLGGSIRSISSGGGDHTCAVDLSGRARCWGQGQDGRLGTGTDDVLGVTQTPADAGRVLLDDPVRRTFAGFQHTCAIETGGGVACFGLNDDGQLGYGTILSYGDDEPPLDAYVQLGKLGVHSAALTDRSTCVLLDDRTVRCWGSADLGQLAYGNVDTVGDDELPADYPEFGPIKLTAGATQLDSGPEHTCARTTDARLRCWGNGADGRLGNADEKSIGDDVQDVPISAIRVFR